MIRVATKLSRAKWVGHSCWMKKTGARRWTRFWMKPLPKRKSPTSTIQLASGETFQEHNLYRAAFDLTLWIDQLFDQNPTLQNEPAAVKLATHAALASAKLAAALSGDHLDEIGMTIAYLKRALKAITTSMNAAAQLRKAAGLISRSDYLVLQQRLFEVRDGIISLMGEYRGRVAPSFRPGQFSALNEIRARSVQSCKRKRLWRSPMCRNWTW